MTEAMVGTIALTVLAVAFVIGAMVISGQQTRREEYEDDEE